MRICLFLILLRSIFLTATVLEVHDPVTSINISFSDPNVVFAVNQIPKAYAITPGGILPQGAASESKPDISGPKPEPSNGLVAPEPQPAASQTKDGTSGSKPEPSNGLVAPEPQPAASQTKDGTSGPKPEPSNGLVAPEPEPAASAKLAAYKSRRAPRKPKKPRVAARCKKLIPTPKETCKNKKKKTFKGHYYNVQSGKCEKWKVRACGINDSKKKYNSFDLKSECEVQCGVN